jgi:hypothetical protein
VNNFLDNLVDRAVNAEQGVRPFLPSLFEPAAPVSEPAWPEKAEPMRVEPFDVALEQETHHASPAPSFSQKQSGESKRDSQPGKQNDRPPDVGQRHSLAHQVFQPDTPSPPALVQLSEAAPGAGFEQASPKFATAPLRPEPPSAVDRREAMVEEQAPPKLATAPFRPKLSSAVDRREAMVEEKVINQIVNKTVLQPALQSQPAKGNGRHKQVFQSDTPSPPLIARWNEAAPGSGFEQTPPKLATAPLRREVSSTVDRREAMVEEQAPPKLATAPFRPKLSSAVDRREAMVEEKAIEQIVNKIDLLSASRDEAQAVEAARNETSTPLVVRPKLDRYAEPPMPRPQPKAQTQSAPPSEQVINVTIGRIEVRATPPPAATSRSNNQKPPGMSLDDYLRQRSGGGRGGGV